MRWFKHYSDLSRDEGVSRYLDEARKDRVTAYGFLMFVLEAIASRMHAAEGHLVCTATYSIPQWGRITNCHPNRVTKYLRLCEVIEWVQVEFEGGSCTVTIPKMVQWRDEYTRKSGHAPDNVAQRKEEKTIEKGTREDALSRSPAPGVKNSNFPAPNAPNGHILSGIKLGQASKSPNIDPRSWEELKMLVKPRVEQFGSDPQVLHRLAGPSLRMSQKQIATCVEQLVADGEVTLPVVPCRAGS